MPADELATLGASASAGMVLTPKARVFCVQQQMSYHTKAGFGFGLHLFNDDTRPSGHISRPRMAAILQMMFSN